MHYVQLARDLYVSAAHAGMIRIPGQQWHDVCMTETCTRSAEHHRHLSSVLQPLLPMLLAKGREGEPGRKSASLSCMCLVTTLQNPLQLLKHMC